MHCSHLGSMWFESVHANICPRLVLQSVGTSFINKLPFHSTCLPNHHIPSSHSTAGGDSFHVSIHGLAVNGPFIASICERASSAIGSLKRPHLRRGPATGTLMVEAGIVSTAWRPALVCFSHTSLRNSQPFFSPSAPPPPPQTLLLVLRLEHLLTPTSVYRSPRCP